MAQFKKWRMVDIEQIRKVHAVLEKYKTVRHLDLMIHPLADDYGAGEGPAGIADDNFGTLALISKELLTKGSAKRFRPVQREEEILGESVKQLSDVYTPLNRQYWGPHYRLDYNAHWDVLLKNLQERGLKAHVLERSTRNLFSKLNNIMAHCTFKYNYPSTDEEINLLVEDSLRSFQWDHSQRERDARHIFHCLIHKIDFFLTMDYKTIVNPIRANIHRIKQHFNLAGYSLEIVTPKELFY